MKDDLFLFKDEMIVMLDLNTTIFIYRTNTFAKNQL